MAMTDAMTDDRKAAMEKTIREARGCAPGICGGKSPEDAVREMRDNISDETAFSLVYGYSKRSSNQFGVPSIEGSTVDIDFDAPIEVR